MPPCDKQQPESLDSTTWTAIDELAITIHGQRDIDMLQTATLKGIEGLVPHRIAMFDLIELDSHGVPAYIHPVCTSMDERAIKDYYERYAAMDYTTWSFDLGKVGVYRDLDLVDVARRDTTPIYREWMEPQDVYFGCTATLACHERPLGSITLFRERAAGDFTDLELTVLLKVARHASIALDNLCPRGIKLEAQNNTGPLDDLIATHGIQPREAEVLRLMLAGKTNRQMADELFISESTVKKHVNAVYRKLGVKNRLGLMAAVRDIDRRSDPGE